MSRHVAHHEVGHAGMSVVDVSTPVQLLRGKTLARDVSIACCVGCSWKKVPGCKVVVGEHGMSVSQELVCLHMPQGR